MKYNPRFPKCPYKSSRNSSCSNKSCPKRCIHDNPNNCDKYNDIIKRNKIDSRAVYGDIKHMGELYNGL